MRKLRVGDMVVACRDFDLYVSEGRFECPIAAGGLILVLEEVGRSVFFVDYRVLTSRGVVGMGPVDRALPTAVG